MMLDVRKLEKDIDFGDQAINLASTILGVPPRELTVYCSFHLLPAADLWAIGNGTSWIWSEGA